MAIQRRSIIWVDASGNTRQTLPTADPDNSAIMAALLNHSNADVINYIESPITRFTPSPAAATYQSVNDYARLLFSASTGEEATVIIPAPKANIFLADSVTVDSSVITDVISACTGHLVVASGATVSTYLAGIRLQVR